VDFAFTGRDGSVANLGALFSAPALAFDVESSGVHTHSDVPLGFSVTDGPNHAYYANIENQYFRELMNNPDTLYIGHNIKYDRSKMKQAGVTINNVCDTMIAAHLREDRPLSLDELIRDKTGRSIQTFNEYRKPIVASTPQELVEHFGPHARATWILWHGYEDDTHSWPGYEKELRRNIVWDTFWDLEMPLVPVLSDMEMNGVQIDAAYLAELGRYFDEKISILDEACQYWAGTTSVNFNSADQVADVLYNKLKIKPPWRKTSGGRGKPPRYTVEGKYLETIKHTHPILPYYLLYKQFQKLKGTYVEGMLEKLVDDRIYCSFNQTGTVTSRLSSSGPNLQNIPQRREEGRKIRRAFIAPPDYWLVKADADQLELKVGAHCSQDPFMLDAFRRGRDIHMETAMRRWGDPKRRPEGKTANFQNQYGGGTPEQKEAFFTAYPRMKKWQDKTKALARETGYVRTLFKRKRTIPEIFSDSRKMREHGEREAISTIIQGSSAEVVKVGMRRIWEDIRDTDIRMVLQVHDELVFEVPDNMLNDFMPHLKQRLQYNELSLPITYSISYGRNWEQMEKYDAEKYSGKPALEMAA
jgi:DNA polymerase-1